MVQGTVEAIWALGLGGSRLYTSAFCLPVIRPRRSRAVLSILLCSALSSTASTPSGASLGLVAAGDYIYTGKQSRTGGQAQLLYYSHGPCHGFGHC